MFGKKILTKKEQKHLRENKTTTLYLFKETRLCQKQFESQFPGTTSCFQCRAIAKKLGLED